MQNETITIGFTDTEPRVYVNGELRKSTLEVVWDEDGAIEKVYLALKPKRRTLTFCGEPIHNRVEVITIERVDGDVAHLRHKNCPSAGEALTEVGAVASAAKLVDYTWESPVSDARVATCPLCERSLPLHGSHMSSAAAEITVDRVDGDTVYLRHKDCPSGGPSPTLSDWTWDVASGTAECPGCKQTLPVA